MVAFGTILASIYKVLFDLKCEKHDWVSIEDKKN